MLLKEKIDIGVEKDGEAARSSLRVVRPTTYLVRSKNKLMWTGYSTWYTAYSLSLIHI